MQLECSGILSICLDNLIFFNFWVVFGVLGGESLQRSVGSLGGETTGGVRSDSWGMKVQDILDQSYIKSMSAVVSWMSVLGTMYVMYTM